jgi:hypothetical protein
MPTFVDQISTALTSSIEALPGYNKTKRAATATTS